MYAPKPWLDFVRKFTLDKELVEQMDRLQHVSEQCADDSMKESLSEACDSICQPVRSALSGECDGCVEEHVFDDVEMFTAWAAAGKDSNSAPEEPSIKSTVFDVLSQHAKLVGGRTVLGHLVRNPTSDHAVLARRQQCLRKLGDNAQLVDRMRTSLSRLASLEPDVMWAFQKPTEEAQALYDMLFFESWFTRGLNSSPGSLTAFAIQRIIVSPLIGLLTPVVYVVLPYLVLRYQGIRMGFATYVRMLYRSFVMAGAMITRGMAGGGWLRYISFAFTIIFYFQSLFSSFESARTLTTVSRIITNKMKNVHEFLTTACQMRNDALANGVDVAQAWLPQGSVLHGVQKEFCGPALPSFSLLSNFGRSLTAFKQFDAGENGLTVQWASLLDAVMAINETRASLGFCYTDFVGIAKPALLATDVWHPCLPPSKVVKNTVALGDSNMILTGPNAGGKSTLLKSILISAILSQTVTVAPCSKLVMTPFRLIRSQINVPDCKGSQSLFEAEMLRCKDSLDKLQKLRAEGRFSLVVMDEVFSSTNVVEGISGAYAVAKALAALPHNISVISTHFIYLCKLEKDTGKRFRNFKMQVDIDGSGAIAYPYVMAKGISKQFVALELLKLNGFDKDILEDALRVRKRLTQPSEDQNKDQNEDKK